MNGAVRRAGAEMNPYEPPELVVYPQARVDRVAFRKRNPAKTYLIVCALLCFFGASIITRAGGEIASF